MLHSLVYNTLTAGADISLSYSAEKRNQDHVYDCLQIGKSDYRIEEQSKLITPKSMKSILRETESEMMLKIKGS